MSHYSYPAFGIFIYIPIYIYIYKCMCWGHQGETSNEIAGHTVYEIIWLGDAKNNCNLIDGGEFLTELWRHGQGDPE